MASIAMADISIPQVTASLCSGLYLGFAAGWATTDTDVDRLEAVLKALK